MDAGRVAATAKVRMNSFVVFTEAAAILVPRWFRSIGNILKHLRHFSMQREFSHVPRDARLMLLSHFDQIQIVGYTNLDGGVIEKKLSPFVVPAWVALYFDVAVPTPFTQVIKVLHSIQLGEKKSTYFSNNDQQCTVYMTWTYPKEPLEFRFQNSGLCVPQTRLEQLIWFRRLPKDHMLARPEHNQMLFEQQEVISVSATMTGRGWWATATSTRFQVYSCERETALIKQTKERQSSRTKNHHIGGPFSFYLYSSSAALFFSSLSTSFQPTSSRTMLWDVSTRDPPAGSLDGSRPSLSLDPFPFLSLLANAQLA